MSYEKQNFEPGQVLTAAQLNHIEEGIEKILPVIEEGSEKQLISDNEGNLAWIDTTHGYTVEEGLLFEPVNYVIGPTSVKYLMSWDANSEFSIFVGEEKIEPIKTQFASGSCVIYLANNSYVCLYESRCDLDLYDNNYVGKKFTIKVKNTIYNKINENFLPFNITAGTGQNSLKLISFGGSGEASGRNSISIDTCKATGGTSFATGYGTEAKGNYSFTQGINTIASGAAQSVFGQHNIEDTVQGTPKTKNLMIVGNGSGNSARSNAYTLDWSGNAWFAGTVEGTGVIVKSSTEGSNKRFMLTVDDSGTISATEIIE